MLKLGAFYQQLLAEVGHLGALTPHKLSTGVTEMALASPPMIWTVLRSQPFSGTPVMCAVAMADVFPAHDPPSADLRVRWDTTVPHCPLLA